MNIRYSYHTQVISKHREMLTRHIPTRSGETRGLFPGQVIFLLCMHDMERMRSATGLPASLVSYFTNNGLNKNLGLVQCMESIAEKVRISKRCDYETHYFPGHTRMCHRPQSTCRQAILTPSVVATTAYSIDLQHPSDCKSSRGRVQIPQSSDHLLPILDV